MNVEPVAAIGRGFVLLRIDQNDVARDGVVLRAVVEIDVAVCVALIGDDIARNRRTGLSAEDVDGAAVT